VGRFLRGGVPLSLLGGRALFPVLLLLLLLLLLLVPGSISSPQSSSRPLQTQK
jgi:hypothetical protein